MYEIIMKTSRLCQETTKLAALKDQLTSPLEREVSLLSVKARNIYESITSPVATLLHEMRCRNFR